jgi:hypothetical protein
MSTNDKVEYIDIDVACDLLPYFDMISELFNECFGRKLDRQLWDWAYQNNPSGSAFVSLAISGGKVVGHYTSIPMPVENSTEKIDGYLTMTIMVSAAYRRYRLFQVLGERVFERINATNKPSAVFGFPNDNSAPGFRKRLGWIISEEYKIIELTQTTQKQCAALLEKQDFSSLFTLNLNEQALKNWRVNKPSQEWGINEGVGLKVFDGGSDLMYLAHPSLISSIEIKDKVNVILPIGELPEFSNMHVAFPYRFGYRLFNCEHINNPQFFVQMCMSDVF